MSIHCNGISKDLEYNLLFFFSGFLETFICHIYKQTGVSCISQPHSYSLCSGHFCMRADIGQSAALFNISWECVCRWTQIFPFCLCHLQYLSSVFSLNPLWWLKFVWWKFCICFTFSCHHSLTVVTFRIPYTNTLQNDSTTVTLM